MDAMTYDAYDALSRFIDGEMDAAEARTFRSTLDADAALRGAVDDCTMIRDTARKFARSLTPPAAVTASLFTKLGMPVDAPAAGGTERTAPWRRRLWMIIVSALFLAGTAAVLLQITRESELDRSAGDGAATRHGAPAAVAPAGRSGASDAAAGHEAAARAKSAEADRPSTAAAADADARREGPAAGKTRTAHLPAPAAEAQPRSATRMSMADSHARERTASASSETGKRAAAGDRHTSAGGGGSERAPAQRVNEERAAAAAPAAADTRAAPGAGALATQSSAAEARPVPPLFEETDLPEIQILRPRFTSTLQGPRVPGGIDVWLRGFSTRSTPAATIGTKSDPLFTNMAAGVEYAIDDRHAVGVEFGQEAFPQRYGGTENAAGVRYEQNLLTPWAAAQYRYRMTGWTLFGRVVPFAAASAGVTREIWPLARVRTGVSVMLAAQSSAFLAAEGTMLLYPFQSTWFSTKKIGLTYGISIAF